MTRKLLSRILIVMAFLLPSLNCSWWQKHEPAIDCTAIGVVADAPALIKIILDCSGISSAATILPCVEAIAGTQWPKDILQCFTAASAGKTKCPAYDEAKALIKPVPLKASSSGMVFVINNANHMQVPVPTLPGLIIDQSVSPMVVRGVALSQAAAAQAVTVLPNNQYNYGYAGQWSATGSSPLLRPAVCYMGAQYCSPTWDINKLFYAALVGGMTGYQAAFVTFADCQAWKASQGIFGLTLFCTEGWFLVTG